MNEYIAAAVDELFELGVRHVVFSGGISLDEYGRTIHGSRRLQNIL